MRTSQGGFNQTEIQILLMVFRERERSLHAEIEECGVTLLHDDSPGYLSQVFSSK